MSLGALLISITLVVHLALVIIVLMNDFKDINHRLFSLFVSISTVWMFVSYLSNTGATDGFHYYFLLANFGLAPYIGYSLFLLAWKLFGNYRENETLLKVLFIVTVILSVVSIFTDLIIEQVYLHNVVLSYKYGDYDWIYSLLIGLMLLGATFILVDKYRHAQGADKRSVLYLLLGAGIPAIIAVSTILVIRRVYMVIDPTNIFFLKTLPDIGRFSIILFAFFGTYALLRRKMFDIKVYSSNLIFWLISTIAIFATFYMAVLIETSIFTSIFTSESIVMSVILAIFLSILYVFWGEKLREKITSRVSQMLHVEDSINDRHVKQFHMKPTVEQKIDYLFENIVEQGREEKLGVMIMPKDDTGDLYLRLAGFNKDEAIYIQQHDVLNNMLEKGGEQPQDYELFGTTYKYINVNVRDRDVLLFIQGANQDKIDAIIQLVVG